MSLSVREALANCLPTGVRVSGQNVRDVDLDRLPPELILTNGVRRRQVEFAAGRLAAAAAIERLGCSPVYPGIGAARQPLWPCGIVGSITHSHELALAATARCDHLAGLGIDLEICQPLEDGTIDQLLTREELAQWEPHTNLDDKELVIALFSFKESIFKCVFPLCNTFLDFLEVTLLPGADGPSAQCIDSGHPAADHVARTRGRFMQVDGVIVSGCWIPN
jgi:4'-phosphopantetheinyl transferase EntD